MGYLLSSLAQLPIDDEVGLYIFVINGQWKGGLQEVIARNFERLAEEIGDAAVIAKSFGKNAHDWTLDIARKYLGKDYKELSDLLPALLITNAHPNNLSDKSTRLLIPLEQVNEKFGNFDAFFSQLVSFTQGNNPDFIKLFKRAGRLRRTLNTLELKPNFAGVGINLNALIEHLIE